MRGFSWVRWLSGVGLLLAGLGMTGANAVGEMMIGPHNTDHRHVEKMPKAWHASPISYKDVPEGSDLVLSLDQQLYPALLPLVQEFAAQHKLKIAVQEGTCGISSGALSDKRVDMAGFCCPPGESDRLPGLQYHTLGIGAIAMIRHADNPVAEISSAMARRVYTGEVGSWQEASGAKQPLPSLAGIKSTARLHCKARPGHWRLILDNEDQFSPTVTEVSTIEDMLKRIGSDREALGYETLWMVKRFSNGKVATMKVDGVAPEDDAALAAGRYPFYRTFNVTTWSDPSLARPEVAQLLAYLQENFHRVTDEYGFVGAPQLRAAGWRFAGDEMLEPPQAR